MKSFKLGSNVTLKKLKRIQWNHSNIRILEWFNVIIQTLKDFRIAFNCSNVQKIKKRCRPKITMQGCPSSIIKHHIKCCTHTNMINLFLIGAHEDLLLITLKGADTRFRIDCCILGYRFSGRVRDSPFFFSFSSFFLLRCQGIWALSFSLN